MDPVVAVPEKIVSWLSEQDELSDVTFFTEFPPAQKAVPLKKAIVAVGIEQLEITDKFVANDDGVLERQEYCRTANITARLSICVPYSYGGSACHDYFTKIIDALTFRTDLEIIQSGCDEIESDRDTSALVCRGRFKIVTDFCPASNTEDNFLTVFDKEFICGSHVANSDIHVTAEDKQLWNMPFVTGYYMGTGTMANTISLGFEPSIVFIFSTDNPLTKVDFNNSSAKTMASVAIRNYNSAGIMIESNGFRVYRYSSGDNTVNFNEAASVYGYIAFK